jgi:hypothetical protein
VIYALLPTFHIVLQVLGYIEPGTGARKLARFLLLVTAHFSGFGLLNVLARLLVWCIKACPVIYMCYAVLPEPALSEIAWAHRVQQVRKVSSGPNVESGSVR